MIYDFLWSWGGGYTFQIKIKKKRQKVYPHQEWGILIEQQLGWEIKQYWVSNFLKNELEYSYKRGSDRSTRVRSSTSICKQAIFWYKLIAKMPAGCLVINIDKSSFWRSVKQNYALLLKNQSSGIVNVGALGRTTLIFSLMSTESWNGLLVYETIKDKI